MGEYRTLPNNEDIFWEIHRNILRIIYLEQINLERKGDDSDSQITRRQKYEKEIDSGESSFDLQQPDNHEEVDGDDECRYDDVDSCE